MFKKLVAVLFILLMATSAWAALVVDVGNDKNFLYVKLDGAADFDWYTTTITLPAAMSGKKLTDVFPYGLNVQSISYAAPAAGAKLIIRDRISTGAIIPPKFYSVDGGPQVKYLQGGVYYRPYILNSEQTTPTNAEVWFELVK